MAQTVEELLQIVLGRQLIQITMLTVQVQTLQERVAELQATKQVAKPSP